MSYHTDTAGNHYMGDLSYGNHNINYTDQYYPQSTVTEQNLNTHLNTLFTNSGLQTRYIADNTFMQNLTNGQFLIFSPQGDTIDDRVTFTWGFNHYTGNAPNNQASVSLYDDAGYVGSDTGSLWNTNRLANIEMSTNNQVSNNTLKNIEKTDRTNHSDIYWAASTDNYSLALAMFQRDFADNRTRCSFWYYGKLTDINTNQSYYDSDPIFTQVVGQFCNTGNTTADFDTLTPFFKHNINGVEKGLATTSEAEYTITCADATPYSRNLCTSLYLFDDNAMLGYPAIGKAPLLLCSYGLDLEVGQVVDINGGMPDTGSSKYVVVNDKNWNQMYNDRVILMRIHST